MALVDELTDNQRTTPYVALAICTRNRASRLNHLLECIKQLSTFPASILIVDSSDSPCDSVASKRAAEALSSIGLDATYLPDTPGLPHQRNTAINWITQNRPKISWLSFLDDDIQIDREFYEKVESLVLRSPEAAVIGGFDIARQSNKRRPILQRLSILPSDAGRIAKSGLSIAPIPTAEKEAVDFVPGGMQVVNLQRLGDVRLDETSLIYGEDIELHIRLHSKGVIYASSLLGVRHSSEQSGKEGIFKRTVGENLSRMRMHLIKPTLVTFHHVVLGTCVLGAASLLQARSLGPAVAIATFKGHVWSLWPSIRMKLQACTRSGKSRRGRSLR